MKKVSTIAYVHSKICESICFEGVNKSALKLDGVVYGRNFRGSLHKNSITLLEDQIFDDMSLLVYGVLFQKFIERMQCDEIKLILPHFFNPLFKIFASHEKVKEIFFIEEGDLSYEENQYPNNDWKNNCDKEINKKYLNILNNMGYIIQSNEIYMHGASNWFGNPWGKYSGSIVTNDAALKYFPGQRIVISMIVKNIFEFPVGLLLITHPDQYIQRLESLMKDNYLHIEKKVLNQITLEVMCEWLDDNRESMKSSVDLWYYKLHPSVLPKDELYFDGYCSLHFNKWENSQAEFFARGVDFSYINFDRIISIGNTSALRYSRDARGNNYDFTVVEDDVILKRIINKIIYLMNIRANIPN